MPPTFFERHDRTGRGLLVSALAEIFEFGEEIRQDDEAFEAFLNARNVKLSKVTKSNPYNSLVALAFSDACGKSWRSEMSTVLHYAAENRGKPPIADWLQEKSISERYDEAVKFFSRTSATKAQSLKSARLEMITKELKGARVVAQELPGLTLADGFHRSLIYANGGQTFLVHVNAGEDSGTVEKYLLELAGKRVPDEHPLAGRQFYPLFRAITCITATCGKSNNSSLQIIVLWNETSDARRVTKLRFVSDAYNFTSVTMTLATALPELEGRGQVALELADAKIFVERYPHDYEWSFAFERDRVFVVDTAPAATRVELLPMTGFSGAKLRQGGQLGRRTRQFRATCEGMKSATYNLKMAHELFKNENVKRVTRAAAPNRLQWFHRDRNLQVGFGVDNSWYSKLAYPFLEFAGPVDEIDPQMELSLDDISALWEMAPQFGEDLSGFIADGDVADAAFCIDHVFGNGDRVEYISPMVLGLSMARTQVCQDFVAEKATGTEDV